MDLVLDGPHGEVVKVKVAGAFPKAEGAPSPKVGERVPTPPAIQSLPKWLPEVGARRGHFNLDQGIIDPHFDKCKGWGGGLPASVV